MDELFDPQSSPFKFDSEIYSSDFFFFEAFFVAGFSTVSVASVFGAVRFALGAAAAPPRLRPLLSANFAGLAAAAGAVLVLLLGSGFASLLSEIVT
jgi:hypothetical protein